MAAGANKVQAEAKFRVIKSAYDEILKGPRLPLRRTDAHRPPAPRAAHSLGLLTTPLLLLSRRASGLRASSAGHTRLPRVRARLVQVRRRGEALVVGALGGQGSARAQPLRIPPAVSCRAHHGVDAEGPIRCGGPYGGYATEGDFYRWLCLGALAARLAPDLLSSARRDGALAPFGRRAWACRAMFRTTRNNPFALILAGLACIPLVAVAVNIANGCAAEGARIVAPSVR